ncbi:trinucleotide repeat-containing gene 18 protein-like [Cyclospora cayetanensis]|uniref:Trinucleotide repeat-containing gene 18 protein-like n=1 Tax=Cyclospora cayetanensis TaxID=88456 RepID=A0A6P6RX59_9EIME|nr:trinucleotide repeat-containing gene 18 protein-like [Cyclospora cayetanensis]
MLALAEKTSGRERSILSSAAPLETPLPVKNGQPTGAGGTSRPGTRGPFPKDKHALADSQSGGSAASAAAAAVLTAGSAAVAATSHAAAAAAAAASGELLPAESSREPPLTRAFHNPGRKKGFSRSTARPAVQTPRAASTHARQHGATAVPQEEATTSPTPTSRGEQIPDHAVFPRLRIPYEQKKEAHGTLHSAAAAGTPAKTARGGSTWSSDLRTPSRVCEEPARGSEERRPPAFERGPPPLLEGCSARDGRFRAAAAAAAAAPLRLLTIATRQTPPAQTALPNAHGALQQIPSPSPQRAIQDPFEVAPTLASLAATRR